MAIPEWLRHSAEVRSQSERPSAETRIGKSEVRKTKERFLDKTLGHVVAFTEDTMFNETTSLKNGFLQKIEPRLKVLTIMFFIILLSLQKYFCHISIFPGFISISSYLKNTGAPFYTKNSACFFFTLLISLPATLNVIVPGEPFANLYRFSRPYSIGGLTIPGKSISQNRGY